MSTKSYKELRWILRGLSGLIIVFSLLMFIGETYFGENPGKPLANIAILQLSIAGIGLIGLGLAWVWELIGGIIALVPFFCVSYNKSYCTRKPIDVYFANYSNTIHYALGT